MRPIRPTCGEAATLIGRRIQMFIENWDRDYLEDKQERHRSGQGDRCAALRRTIRVNS
jgi:hypothetical protein